MGFSSKSTFKQKKEDPNDPLNIGTFDIGNTKSTEFSAVFGADLGIAMSGFNVVLDVRYNLGLTKAFEDADAMNGFLFNNDEWLLIDRTTGEADDMKNRSFSLSLGVSFPLGGG